MYHVSLIFGFILIIGIIGISFAEPGDNRTSSPYVSDGPDSNPGNEPHIPVGVIVMKSGFVSDIGTEYSRAFNMAQMSNPVSLVQPVIIDGGSNASTGSAAWREMRNMTPSLPIVVTVSSWNTNIVYPDAADRGIIQIALGSAAVNRSHPADRLVRFTPGVDQESPVLAAYLSRFNRIALIGGENDYTNGYFSALGTLLPGNICLEKYYNSNAIESTLNITAIIRSEPDVIVLLSFSEGAKIEELLRDGGITVSLVGTRGIESNVLTRTPAAEGLIFTTPALNESHPFFTRYVHEYGENATFYGAEGFDGMASLYNAVSICHSSSDCIYSRYQNETYHGALGTVTFDEKGVAFYPIKLKMVHNGSYVELPDYPPVVKGGEPKK
jgi:ABC-type branched-subunit amino acid transport system substrate-binding protein